MFQMLYDARINHWKLTKTLRQLLIWHEGKLYLSKGDTCSNKYRGACHFLDFLQLERKHETWKSQQHHELPEWLRAGTYILGGKDEGLGLLPPGEGMALRGPNSFFHCLQEGHRDGAKLFRIAHGGRMRDSREKKQEQFTQDLRRNFPHKNFFFLFPKNLFPIGEWSSCSVQSPAFEGFKTWLDQALNNLVWSHGWPCSEQEVALETSWGPLETEFLYDTMMPMKNLCLPHKHFSHDFSKCCRALKGAL